MSKNDTLIFNNSSTIMDAKPNTMNFNRIIWILAAYSFLVGGAFLWGRYFSHPKKSGQINHKDLQNAIDRCVEEVDNQNSEVEVITHALNEFNQESQYVIDQNIQRRVAAGCGLFPVANEKTALLETREQVEIKQQLEELIILTAHYPKSGYKDNPCIETVESYMDARKIHHGKVVALATVLLPNLGALLHAARVVNNEPLRKH